MHRFIIRFEHVARNAVLLVYLSALFLATATYFVGHSLGFGGDLLWYVGIAEALAVEVHSFLSQRLTRGLYEELHIERAEPLPYAAQDALEKRYALHYRITVGLVAFSCFNSVAFWAAIMQPRNFGDWLQVGIRGAVIPVGFLAAGFLTKLREDVDDTLTDAGDDLERTMVASATKQWRQRVRRARKRGANLAEPLASLLEMREKGGMPASVRVRMMDAAILAAEDGSPRAAKSASSNASAPVEAAPPQEPTPSRGPTGPGSPAAGRASKRARSGRERSGGVIRLMDAKPNAEQRIRAEVERNPGIKLRTLARRANVSESTASKYLAIIRAELERAERERIAAEDAAAIAEQRGDMAK